MEYIEYNFTRERRRGGEKKRMMERVERVGEGKREREREREEIANYIRRRSSVNKVQ